MPVMKFLLVTKFPVTISIPLNWLFFKIIKSQPRSMTYIFRTASLFEPIVSDLTPGWLLKKHLLLIVSQSKWMSVKSSFLAGVSMHKMGIPKVNLCPKKCGEWFSLKNKRTKQKMYSSCSQYLLYPLVKELKGLKMQE